MCYVSSNLNRCTINITNVCQFNFHYYPPLDEKLCNKMLKFLSGSESSLVIKETLTHFIGNKTHTWSCIIYLSVCCNLPKSFTRFLSGLLCL